MIKLIRLISVDYISFDQHKLYCYDDILIYSLAIEMLFLQAFPLRNKHQHIYLHDSCLQTVPVDSLTIHTKSLDRSVTQQLTTKTTHERIILYLIAPSFVTVVKSPMT